MPLPTVERTLELAQGHPLALLELPAALVDQVPAEHVTAPDRVRTASAKRLDALFAESHWALMLAAARISRLRGIASIVTWL